MGKTHEMLMRAEAGVQNSQPGQVSTGDFERRLLRLGLSKNRIQKQNIYELRRTLILLSGWIDRLDKAFRFDTELEQDASLKNFDKKIVSILSDLRKSALEKYSALINKEKIQMIKTQLDFITDEKIRREIETNLLQIELKDQIILREYSKLDSISEKYRP